MNSFPLRRSESLAQPLSRLAELLAVPTPGGDLEVRGVAPIADAGPDQLGFLAHRRFIGGVADSAAGALLVSEELGDSLLEDRRPRLVVKDAYIALASILDSFFPQQEAPSQIHFSAVLGVGVRLGSALRIGPYAVIESGAEVADRCQIGAHCVVGAGARIGPEAILHPHVVVYPGAEVGERVILHAGARIGVDGFGYTSHEGRHQKIPQVGACVIENDVEIGANTTIDRGSIGETRVHAGAKLDNLVHLGHNVVVGSGAILAGQVGVAGSSRIESGVMAGGQAGVAGHLTVGEGAQLSAQAGIISDIPAGETVMGFPARPRGEFLRSTVAQGKVPELLQRVRKLEQKLGPPGDEPSQTSTGAAR